MYIYICMYTRCILYNNSLSVWLNVDCCELELKKHLLLTLFLKNLKWIYWKNVDPELKSKQAISHVAHQRQIILSVVVGIDIFRV